MIVTTVMIIRQPKTNSVNRIHFLLKAAVGLLAKIALLNFLASLWKLEAFSNAGLPIWWVKKVLGSSCTLGFDYKALHCFEHLISLVPVNICLVSQISQLLRIQRWGCLCIWGTSCGNLTMFLFRGEGKESLRLCWDTVSAGCEVSGLWGVT